MSLPTIAAQRFSALYHREPEFIVRAPGRVNLIGEHTDYNGGFVLPMAINRAVWVALSPRDDRIVSIHSADYDQTASFSLDSLTKGKHDWLEYPKGVAWALQDAGYTLQGWDGVTTGDIPQGAGLSSSAAVEIATLCAFAAVSSLDIDPTKRALLSQKAENQWVGVQCGIMDQLISSCGKAHHALLIDCRSLESTPVPLPKETAVAIMDTSTRRGLMESAYNERRKQCEEACQAFGVSLLRDVTPERFAAESDQLETLTRRRARHVVSENARTLSAAKALQAGDVSRMGKLMQESHISLRDDFEVSNEALNTMVEIAQTHPSCWGARMTGAGFGGCAVALIQAGDTEDFVQTVQNAYSQSTGLSPSIYVCMAADGGTATPWKEFKKGIA